MLITAAAATAVAGVSASYVAVRAAHGRLEREAKALSEDDETVETLRSEASRRDLEKFRQALKESCLLESLEAKCADHEAFAERWRRRACGLRLGGICRASTAHAVAAAARRGALTEVRAFFEAERLPLERLEVAARARETLPPAAPWRAPWQKRELAGDARRVAEFARRRRPTSEGPLEAYAAELEALQTSAAVALAHAKDSEMAAIKTEATATLELVATSPDLFAERRELRRLREARRAADAAERAADEQRRARLATEDAATQRRRCSRALEKLVAALGGRASFTSPARAPAALADCRNDDDPVSLEPLSTFALDDLCLLPSRNCIPRLHLRHLHRDPFTNIQLPPHFKSNNNKNNAEHRDGADFARLIQAAERACGGG